MGEQVSTVDSSRNHYERIHHSLTRGETGSVLERHHTVLDYTDLFSVTLRGDDVQEFDTRWYEVQLHMSNIPSDDVLERLY